jgi:hypothetical protein
MATADPARIAAPFRATRKQLELARQWRDPAVRVVCVGGAIRSGKSQAAARLLVETAVERPSTYLICRSTYRELEDSTKKIVLHGDGSVPPAIPPELIRQYRASDSVVRLKTGSEILFRSLEEQNVSKLLKHHGWRLPDRPGGGAGRGGGGGADLRHAAGAPLRSVRAAEGAAGLQPERVDALGASAAGRGADARPGCAVCPCDLARQRGESAGGLREGDGGDAGDAPGLPAGPCTTV